MGCIGIQNITLIKDINTMNGKSVGQAHFLVQIYYLYNRKFDQLISFKQKFTFSFSMGFKQ